MKKNYFNDLPNEVVYLELARHYGMPVGADILNEAIEKYPEHFPEEVEYRKKWSAIPQEIKDKYYKTTYRLDTEEQTKQYETMFGNIPHKDIYGCGIIQRVTTFADRGKDFTENDKWLDKVYAFKHKKDVDLYNELFNEYGLSKEYDEK